MHAELPLILFTLLTQMAVGSFVVLGVVQLAARRRHDATTVDRLSDPALYAIGPVMVAALVVSLLHLGNPVNMLNTVRHWDSSWLSREILLGCAFTGLGAAFALCQWRRWATPVLRQALAGVTALVGLGFVWATAHVYRIPTVPAWDSWTTVAGFFATTFLLGCLAVGTAFAVVQAVRQRRGPGDPAVDGLIRASLRGIGVGSLAVLAVELVVLPMWTLDLEPGAGPATGWLILRLVLAVLGAGVLGFFLYRVASRGAERLLLGTAGSAFLLVLVAETLGRVQFFDSYARIGI